MSRRFKGMWGRRSGVSQEHHYSETVEDGQRVLYHRWLEAGWCRIHVRCVQVDGSTYSCTRREESEDKLVPHYISRDLKGEKARKEFERIDSSLQIDKIIKEN